MVYAMRFLIFILLCILMSPLLIFGLIYYTLRIRRICVRQNISGTANEPYASRLMMHIAGARQDDAAYKIDLEGVATFFNLVYRQPVGKNVILFCNSVSCWICRCEDIKDHLSRKLDIDFGQTTEDDEFTFIPVPCLGDCDNAPVMMVGDDPTPV